MKQERRGATGKVQSEGGKEGRKADAGKDKALTGNSENSQNP